MNQHLKTGLTLVVLSVLLFGGAMWGWGALTKPFPKSEDPAICEDMRVAAGEKVRRDQVTVSVFNAGDRAGLAGRTLGLLTDRKFAEGNEGNAPKGTKVRVAEVWADDPTNPAVVLVVSNLPKGTQVVGPPPGDPLGAGVVVVVGDDFQKLAPKKRARKAVRAKSNTTVCTPPELDTAA